ncbi:DUF721 domain-containing protein [Marinoscillum pacificum]|uniref:DUF721 domain-containing protein n=1 Tax=Marinoscillum pacificum TaxID=392723 RepID=UPI0021579F0E|nr:DUF721 domain-containing protein [Marinoscillum pacificum]
MSEQSNSFTNAFRKFLVNEKLDTKYREKLLAESWGDLVGTPIASRTSSVYVANKILFVKLTSAPLKQELTNNKEKVKGLLQKDFGDLFNDIRFI